MPIKADPEVHAFFRASTFTALGNGLSALFWDDRWIHGQAPSDIAPNLVQMMGRRARKHLTVSQGLLNRNWTRTISGNLTLVMIAEYLDLWEATDAIVLNDQPDRTVWRWSPNGQYSAKSAYRALHTGTISFRGHSLIWKSWVPLRVKIFLWLSFKRRH